MALALSAGFLLLFGAFVALGEYALRESENETRHEYLVIARLAAAEIDARLAEAQADLRQTSDLLSALPDDSGDQEALLSGQRRLGVESLELLFVDSSGRIVASAPGEPPHLDADIANFVAQVVNGGGPATSDPFEDNATARPAFALGAPVTRRGRVVGALVDILALDSETMLDALAQAVQIGKTGHAGLLDRQGQVLLSTYGLPFLSPGEHPQFFQEAMSEREDEVKTVPFVLHLPGETAGEQHLMAAAMLKTVPWGVDVGGDASEAFAASRHLRSGLIILGGVALVAIWGGSLWGTRLLVRPVYDLTRSAQRVASGDLSVPLEAGAGGEIGAMVSALEQMRLRLLQTIQSLEDLRATLEARVDERTEALREREAEIRRLLHKVISAQEEERARVAFELHDEVGQLLTAIRLSMDDLHTSAGPTTAGQIARVQDLIERAMADLRRLISGLRPGVIDQLGLMAALREVAEQVLAPLGIRTAIDGPHDRRLPRDAEVVLFRIAQEAMHNVARHSGATSVELSVARRSDHVMMRIHDDGHGFDPTLTRIDSTTGRGFGLLGMRERASLLGGSVKIDSGSHIGTTIEADLPLTDGDNEHTI